MFRVVLVDDEIWSLEGISKLFEWERLGFTVIAQVTDAAEAFDIICSTEPDLVITDIRMPEISGIELLNMTRKKGIRSEFVIVSGYAEFEYAQEALRYGAFDYQLKPIEPVEAGRLLQKLKLHLEEGRMAGDRDLVKQLASGLNNPSDILSRRDYVPRGKYWQVAVCRGNGTIEHGELSSLFPDISCFPLHMEKDKTIIIMNGAQLFEKSTPSIVDRWAAHKGLYVGFSTVADHIGSMARLIKEADMAASDYFIHDKPGVTRFTASYNPSIEGVIGKLEKWIALKAYPELNSVVDSIPDVFNKGDLGIYHVTCLWNQLAVVLRRRLAGGALAGTIDFLDYEEIVNRFNSLPALCGYMKELLKDICFSTAAAGTVKSNQYNGNFIALLEYVNKNYDKELSLSELAERFFLNMTYCSELFKKVTGYTFSGYVTKLRMEAAVELIQSGKYTADTVCGMTGYNDYYYFSKIFKRFHGVAPSQFTRRIMQTSSPDMT